MNKAEFKVNLKKLIEKRNLELKDINKYVANRIDTSSVPEEEKENITKDLKAKALEFFETEKVNRDEIIRKLYEVPDPNGMSAEEYESLMTEIYINVLDALEANQNHMLVLRMEYADFNFLVRERYYHSLEANSTSTGEVFLELPGSSHKIFDPSAEDGGPSSI